MPKIKTRDEFMAALKAGQPIIIEQKQMLDWMDEVIDEVTDEHFDNIVLGRNEQLWGMI